MKCKIVHESGGRMRVHLNCVRTTLRQADVLEFQESLNKSSAAGQRVFCPHAAE